MQLRRSSRQPEAEKFRDRQKEEVKKAQGRAHHQVLKGMDLLSRRHFKEKEGGEDEDEKEHAVLDRALDKSVGVENRQEFRAEK
jgi:hypothetical protein